MNGEDVNKKIITLFRLPRSGTSMMMKMLDAGGMEMLSDELRKQMRTTQKDIMSFEKNKGT